MSKKSNNVRKNAAKALRKNFGEQMKAEGNVLSKAVQAGFKEGGKHLSLVRGVGAGVGAALGTGVQELPKAIKRKVSNLVNTGKLIFNHPDWYIKYPGMISSNLNYAERKGSSEFAQAVSARIDVELDVPLTWGKTSNSWIDGINFIFTKLRGSNSGAFNYSVEDVGMYIIGVLSLRALLGQLRRDITIVNYTDAYTKNTPDYLLLTLGYSASDVNYMKANRADIIAELNQLSTAISLQFPMPAELAYVDRVDWIFSNIYSDSKTFKSTKYMYNLAGCWLNGEDGASSFDWSNLNGVGFAARMSLLRSAVYGMNQLLSKAYNNALAPKIAGDIIKAYGEQAFHDYAMLNITDKPEPIFDEYSLNQIQNSVLCPQRNSIDHLDDTFRYQPSAISVAVTAKGNLSTMPLVTTKSISDRTARPGIVTISKDVVDVGVTLSMIQMMASLYANVASNPVVTIQNSTLTRCSGQTIYYYPNASEGLAPISISFGITPDANETTKVYPLLWSQMDYMPPYYLKVNDKMEACVDLDNYASITTSNLASFIDTSTLSCLKTIDIQEQANFRPAKKQ